MITRPLTLSLLASLIAVATSMSVATAATVDLRVLETTDLHSNMMDFVLLQR